MPGVNIFIQNGIGENAEQFHKKLNEIRTQEFHFVKTFHTDPGFIVNGVFIEGYPVLQWQNGDFDFILEGEIYYSEEEEVKTQSEVLGRLITAEQPDKNKISDWLHNHDGEFVLYVFDRVKRKIYVQNTAYAHLQVYCLQLPGQVAVSREHRTIQKALGYKDLDVVGIAQLLLHGYPLGNRTYYKNMIRLEPSNLLVIDVDEATCKLVKINKMNIGNKFHEDKSPQTNAQNLVDLLHENVAWMPHNFPDFHVGLSLSGGLDSRLVAAAMKNLNIPFTGLTFPDKLLLDSEEQPDVKYAEVIAKTLNASWDYCRVSHPTGHDACELLDVMYGFNFGMVFIMPFYHYLREKYDSKLLHATGETGLDLRDATPHRPVKGMADLTQYLLDNKTKIDVQDIARIMHVSEEQMRGELRAHLEQYPEEKEADKYVHYHLLNYNFNNCCQAEERSRHFYWTPIPLDTTRFFRYAMGVPDSQKKYHVLFREVLLAVNPEIAAIPNHKWNAAITDPKFLKAQKKEERKYKLINTLPTGLKNKLRSFVYRQTKRNIQPLDAPFTECLENQMTNHDEMAQYFNTSEMKKYLEQGENGKYKCVRDLDFPNNLLAITSFIESCFNENIELEKHKEETFKRAVEI